MTINESIKFMKENPGVKITMPHHYKNWQYNYYDEKQDKLLVETGEEWNVNKSIHYNEIDGYEILEEE